MSRRTRLSSSDWLRTAVAPALAAVALALSAGAARSAEPAASAPTPARPADPLDRKVTLDVQDASLVSLFRTIGEQSALNVVIDPSIDQRVTLKLTDVSWNEILTQVLRTYRLGSEREGNVLLVAPLGSDVLAPTAAGGAAEPLETRIVRINYARAQDLAPILTSATLSDRGSVSVDARTNTLVLRDRPQNVREAVALIGHD